MQRTHFASAVVLISIFVILSCSDSQPSTVDEPIAGIGLDDYQLVMGPVAIDQVENNLSGLTYSNKTGTLFAVTNLPEQLVELSTDGLTLRIVTLKGFEDTEGVVHIEGNTFAVAEERRFLLTTFDLGHTTTEVQHDQATKVVVDEADGNTGLEGITYDATANRFLGIKEKDPRKLYSIARTALEGRSDDIREPWNAEEKLFELSDITGVHFDANSGNLLIVSHESCAVVEITPTGKEVSRLSLKAGSAGLEKDIPQAEGITMDAAGNMYICSEPNLFYRFGKALPKKGV